MKDFQYITNSSPAYIEGLYQDFVKNPSSVDPEYQKFFEGFDFLDGLVDQALVPDPFTDQVVGHHAGRVHAPDRNAAERNQK